MKWHHALLPTYKHDNAGLRIVRFWLVLRALIFIFIEMTSGTFSLKWMLSDTLLLDILCELPAGITCSLLGEITSGSLIHLQKHDIAGFSDAQCFRFFKTLLLEWFNVPSLAFQNLRSASHTSTTGTLAKCWASPLLGKPGLFAERCTSGHMRRRRAAFDFCSVNMFKIVFQEMTMRVKAYTAEGWSNIPFANCKTKMPLHLGVDKSFRSIAFAGDWTARWHQSLRLLCWNTCRYWYYPWQIPWQNLTVSMQRIIGIKFQVCQEVICKQEGQAKARASAVLLRVPIKTSQTNWHLSIHPPSQKINCSRGRGEIAGCTFFYGLRKARAKINQGHKVHVPPNAVWQSEESLPAGAMSQSRIHHL